VYERLLFNPISIDWIAIVILSPISILYGSIMYIRRVISAGRSYSIPIISVGNFSRLDGSGKTPFIISLASNLKSIIEIYDYI